MKIEFKSINNQKNEIEETISEFEYKNLKKIYIEALQQMNNINSTNNTNNINSTNSNFEKAKLLINNYKCLSEKTFPILEKIKQNLIYNCILLNKELSNLDLKDSLILEDKNYLFFKIKFLMKEKKNIFKIKKLLNYAKDKKFMCEEYFELRRRFNKFKYKIII